MKTFKDDLEERALTLFEKQITDRLDEVLPEIRQKVIQDYMNHVQVASMQIEEASGGMTFTLRVEFRQKVKE